MSWAEAAYIVSKLRPGGGISGKRIKVTTVQAKASHEEKSGAVTPAITEVDCTGIEGYGTLTLDNFAFIPVRMLGRFQDSSSGQAGFLGRVITPRLEYNPATGTLKMYDIPTVPNSIISTTGLKPLRQK